MWFCPQATKGPLFSINTDNISSNKIMKQPKQIFRIIFLKVTTRRHIRDHLAQTSHFTNKKTETEKLNDLPKVTNHGQLSASGGT